MIVEKLENLTVQIYQNRLLNFQFLGLLQNELQNYPFLTGLHFILEIKQDQWFTFFVYLDLELLIKNGVVVVMVHRKLS